MEKVAEIMFFGYRALFPRKLCEDKELDLMANLYFSFLNQKMINQF